MKNRSDWKKWHDVPCVSASILAANPLHMGRDIEHALQAGSDWLHIDVMDGHFVPNLSFGLPTLKALRVAFPDACLDTHLMISNPDEMAAAYVRAGADVLTFHVEVGTQRIIKTLAEIKKTQLDVKVGLAIKPQTDLALLEPWIANIDMILVMSVQPGFGGQSFMTESLQRIADLCAYCQTLSPEMSPLIQVDGGIDGSNAKVVIEAGTNILVAGSYLFSSPKEFADNVRSLRR